MSRVLCNSSGFTAWVAGVERKGFPGLDLSAEGCCVLASDARVDSLLPLLMLLLPASERHSDRERKPGKRTATNAKATIDAVAVTSLLSSPLVRIIGLRGREMSNVERAH